MRTVANKTFLMVAGLIFLTLASCAEPERTSENRFAEIVAARTMESGVSRADPGYMQYLERQSMHADAARLSQMISGSNFIWRRASASPRPEVLLESGNVWLSVNPQTLQTPGRTTPLAHISGPTLWTSLDQCGISGLYLAPTGAGGNLWDHDLKRPLGVSGDTVQYSFAKSIGTEQDYARIIERSKTHNILLGGELTPAATGIGPDFLLAVRNLRDYPGIYCFIEVPKDLWPVLPAPGRDSGEIQVFALNEAQTMRLSGAGLFPPKLRQDSWAPFIESGWAATGEVRGSDGNLRRWVYRYAGGIKRPVLNFGDPSGTARQIMSGSVIFQSAILGNSLNAARLQALVGLEPESDPPTGLNDPANFSLLTGVAVDLARQSRAYGSRSWLKDELPLAAIQDAAGSGPDLFQDSVFSPAAEHALLSGDVSLLNFMVDEALSFGLDWRRLIHSSIAHEGVSYALPHLRYLSSLAEPGKEPAFRVNRAQSLLTAVYAQARNAAEPGKREPDTSLFESDRLYTTPAGLAAMALGVRHNTELTPELERQIRRGHLLLQFFKAMQPGVFMLSGQDISGVMPIEIKPAGDERLADKRLAPMGSFPLLVSAEAGVYSSLGLPRAKSLYGSLDMQLYQPSSFARELGKIIALRRHMGIADGTLIGRFTPGGPGVSALVTRLPGSSPLARGGTSRLYIVSVVNFSREESSEYFDLRSIPELAGIIDGVRISLLGGDIASVRRQDNWLALTAPGWSGGVVLMEENPGRTPDATKEMKVTVPERGVLEEKPLPDEAEALFEPSEVEEFEVLDEPKMMDEPAGQKTREEEKMLEAPDDFIKPETPGGPDPAENPEPEE